MQRITQRIVKQIAGKDKKRCKKIAKERGAFERANVTAG